MNFESDVIIAHAIHKFTLNESQCNMQLVHINYILIFIFTNLMKHVVNIPQRTELHKLTPAHIAKHLSLFVCSLKFKDFDP